VNPVLPDEAVELAEAATKAFGVIGGVDVARRAELDPTVRTTEVLPVLESLGLGDLDPRADEVALAAAAAWCEAAGRVALPYPLAAALVRDDDGRPTAAVPARAARVDHATVVPGWRVGTLDGASGGVGRPGGAALGTRLGPFVGDLVITEVQAPPLTDLLVHQTLVAWTVLGTVSQAVALTVEHVNTRIQFAKPIASFQAVQFQLADAAVAVAGLRELAGFTLWRLHAANDRARADVLALRLHSLEVARTVLRTCQQLHGAAGVCDEYDVSVLTRMAQPALRLPSGADQVAAALADAIATDGFVGLFGHGGHR
jgi:alkylation response protein AidB-like acyl-CoA dehydrogenase